MPLRSVPVSVSTARKSGWWRIHSALLASSPCQLDPYKCVNSGCSPLTYLLYMSSGSTHSAFLSSKKEACNSGARAFSARQLQSSCPRNPSVSSALNPGTACSGKHQKVKGMHRKPSQRFPAAEKLVTCSVAEGSWGCGPPSG